MLMFDNKEAGSKNGQRIVKYALVAIAGIIVIWISIRFATLIAVSSLYSRFFE